VAIQHVFVAIRHVFAAIRLTHFAASATVSDESTYLKPTVSSIRSHTTNVTRGKGKECQASAPECTTQSLSTGSWRQQRGACVRHVVRSVA
jgi:hypothetical protein